MNKNQTGQVKKHRSIFLRLLFVLLATMGLVHLLIGGAFGLLFNSGSMKYIESNIHYYAESIIEEIGTPPDTVVARQLADTYQIYIAYESDNFQWASHSEMPKKSICFGPSSRWRKPTTISNKDGSQYTLMWRIGPMMGMHRQILFVILLLVTLVFIGLHGYIRRILKPVQWLRKGVDEISIGHFDIKIPRYKNDEFGRLTEAFNEMVQRIKEMILSRDQLLLNVSHELRSPLTRIRVALEFIQDSDKKTAILSDIDDIERMITEILETERLNTEHGQLHRTDTDLVLLVNEVTQKFQKKPPGVQIFSQPKSCIIPLDSERIRMMLKNILENAIKFSRLDSLPVQISLDNKKDKVILLIKDNGLGIPEDQIPYIFEPFFRVDQSRAKTISGYGLGLYFCKKVMDAHVGKISIENNENGQGVTVVLEFKK
jgi:signal transduction histidine kinase